MVKVTIKQDGYDEEVASGNFAFAVVGSFDETEQKDVGYMLGESSDRTTINALQTFVKKAVTTAVDSENQMMAYKILRAMIDTEIKRLETEESVKEETPEAATSGESV